MTTKAPSDLSFDYYCGKCFAPIQRTGNPGYVLSCSDFLCGACGNAALEPFTCPSCRKSNVKILSMSDPCLPVEVSNNVADPERRIEELLAGLRFQIKHYKTTCARMMGRFGRERKEHIKKIAYLESQMNGPVQYPLLEERAFPSETARLAAKRPLADGTGGEHLQLKMARPSTASPMVSTFSTLRPSETQWRTGSTSSVVNISPGSVGRGTTGAAEHEYLSRRPATSASSSSNQPPPAVNSRVGTGLTLSGILSGSQGGAGSGGSGSGDLGRGNADAMFAGQQGQGSIMSAAATSSRHFDVAPNSSSTSNRGSYVGNEGVYEQESGNSNNNSNRPRTSRPLTPSTIHLQHSQQQQQQQHQQLHQGGGGGSVGGGLGGHGRGSGGGGPSFHAMQQQQQLSRPSTTPVQGSRLRSPHMAPPPRTRVASSYMPPAQHQQPQQSQQQSQHQQAFRP